MRLEMENIPANSENCDQIAKDSLAVDRPRASVIFVEALARRRSTRAAIADPVLPRNNPIKHYFMGDCPGVSEWVDSQPEKMASFLRFVESILRTFGALIFVNNVWSGLLFFLAVMINNQFTTLIGVLGIMVSFCTGLLLNVSPDRLRNGVATFNGFMVAQFVTANAVQFSSVLWNPWLIFPALFFSIVSTVMKSALHSVLQHFKIPALNLPFSLTTLCFLASQGSTPAPIFPAYMAPLDHFNNNQSTQSYSAPEIVRGIFFSISNIYGCDNVTSVCLAWLAVLVASPLLFAMCILGSCTGTGIAIVLGVSAKQLASGMWSFNSLLVCGSVGGFFYVWNVFSCALALFAAAFACVVAGSLYHILGFVSLPFQALPLFITDAIFLLALSAYKPRCFIRVEFSDIRYPEQHRQVHCAKVKVSEATTLSKGDTLQHIHNS